MASRTTLARLAGALLWALGTGQTGAQAWPDRPIKLIIPLAAGGATDKAARLMASRLGDALGQQVVPENITGASGEIALKRLAGAPPDGYTLGATANSLHTIAPHTSTLPYDAVKDFRWLGTYAAFEYVLVTAPSSPFANLDALLAAARQAPGTVSYGSSGVGTGNHLAGALLGDSAKVRFNSIPYRGGSPAMVDVVAGRTDVMFDVVGGARALIDAGKLRALATTAKARSSMLPGVPTVAETLPGYEATGWFALVAPAGLRPEIGARLEAALATIATDPAYRAQLEAMGYQADATGAATLQRQIARESAQWRAVIARFPCPPRDAACEQKGEKR